MAKKSAFSFIRNKRKRRPGVHSKNASQGKRGYKKPYRGQGK